jgi:hypothetical protein
VRNELQIQYNNLFSDILDDMYKYRGVWKDSFIKHKINSYKALNFALELSMSLAALCYIYTN